MTITTIDQLMDALANNSSRLLIDKQSVGNAVAGGVFSLWRANGQPGQGATPTAAAVCTKALAGSFGFDNQAAPAASYLAFMALNCTNAAVSMEVHQRIAHMGGLNGTLLTAQTVGMNLHSSGLNPPADYIGDANFSDVSWWLEWYADTGGTASNATVGVTYNDGSTGNLSVVAVGGTVRASRMIALNNFKPAAAAARFIRSVDTLTLSASTGTAGNFGVTATRVRAQCPLLLANKTEAFDWQALTLPSVPNDACLMLVQLASTTTTGAVRGSGKIAHG
jgi:hypothetical protein